jgi:hypothetical protein
MYICLLPAIHSYFRVLDSIKLETIYIFTGGSNKKNKKASIIDPLISELIKVNF